MSTNKTENLKLHAWEPVDAFRREEVNENFSLLDANAGLTWEQLTSQGAALAAEAAARKNAVASEASARSAAVAACAHVLAGSYDGDGESNQSISLGVTPKAVFVLWAGSTLTTASGDQSGGLAVAGRGCGTIDVTAGGFAVREGANKNGWSYNYLALY